MGLTMIKVYLAGKIPKGDEIGQLEDWRAELERQLAATERFEFLSPEDPTLDEAEPRIVFGHDCYLVSRCDILLVNAPEKLGVGTAQEMVIAKYMRKHVYTILPRDTHHRRTNLNMHGRIVADWVHPFIYAMSDAIFESPRDFTDFTAKHPTDLLDLPKKSLSEIDGAVAAYLQTQ